MGCCQERDEDQVSKAKGMSKMAKRGQCLGTEAMTRVRISVQGGILQSIGSANEEIAAGVSIRDKATGHHRLLLIHFK